MKPFLRLYLSLFLIHSPVNNQAQKYPNPTPKGISLGITTAFAFTYTGTNIYLLPEFSFRRQSICVGPKIVADNSYFPHSNTWGLATAYSYFLFFNSRWTSIVKVDYELSLYKAYDPYNLSSSNKYNKVHEMYGILEIDYRFLPDGKLNIHLEMGAGAYLEYFRDLVTSEKHLTVGRASIIRIGFNYKFLRK